MTIGPFDPRLAALAPPARDFGSDNRAPMCGAALNALVDSNATARDDSYGADSWTSRASAALATHFSTPVEVTWVPTGTVANMVAIGAARPGPAACILVAEDAHMRLDEAGAIERAWGTPLVPIPTPEGKLTVEAVETILKALASNSSFSPDPAILAITLISESGRTYTPSEIGRLCRLAHSHGMTVHIDGARFANALAAQPGLNSIFELGAETVVVGGTKNGLHTVEAIVTADPVRTRLVRRAAKQLGAVTSKQRFLTAPAAGCLEGRCWLGHATNANLVATQIGDGLTRIGLEAWRPIDGNLVFVRLGDEELAEALNAWCRVSHWGPDGLVRLACAWDHRADDATRIVAGIAALCVPRTQDNADKPT